MSTINKILGTVWLGCVGLGLLKLSDEVSSPKSIQHIEYQGREIFRTKTLIGTNTSIADSYGNLLSWKEYPESYRLISKKYSQIDSIFENKYSQNKR